MADIDEDSSIRAAPDPTEIDLSDEIQDFRFLSTLSQYSPHRPPRSPPHLANILSEHQITLLSPAEAKNI